MIFYRKYEIWFFIFLKIIVCMVLAWNDRLNKSKGCKQYKILYSMFNSFCSSVYYFLVVAAESLTVTVKLAETVKTDHHFKQPKLIIWTLVSSFLFPLATNWCIVLINRWGLEGLLSLIMFSGMAKLQIPRLVTSVFMSMLFIYVSIW